MKLYISPGACSLSPHIVALEAEIPLELERVDFATKRTSGGADFNAINKKGYVPALQLDDGQLLTEGPAIVQYLADLRPGAGLAPPAGTFARYRLQEWLNFITSELHKAYSPLFSKTAPEEWKAQVREKLLGRITFAAEALGDHPYLLGEAFTVADAYLFTVLRWSRHVHLDLGGLPVITAYMERVAARPAVHAALLAEGLVRPAKT